ncbi:hypothetical protein D9M68_124240 [compost metagenome]
MLRDFSYLSDEALLDRLESYRSDIALWKRQPARLYLVCFAVVFVGLAASIVALIVSGLSLTTGVFALVAGAAYWVTRRHEAVSRTLGQEADVLQAECVRRGLL